MLVGTCLLVNILIAMMDHTQETTNDRPNEWIRQWGRQVLVVEQNVNTKERLKQQQKYTHKLKTGERALIVQWQQKVKFSFFCLLLNSENVLVRFFKKVNEREDAKFNNDAFYEDVKNIPQKFV